MIALFLFHVFACCFMTGVIWLVQILVYPIFQYVGRAEFQNFHCVHMNRITWIVVPVMTLELLTGIGLYIQSPSPLFLWNLVSVVTLWILTALVNGPTHNNLAIESAQSLNHLVLSNWPRTIIWSARCGFLFTILLAQLTGVTA